MVAIGGFRQAEEPAPNIGAYSASKAALVSLMKTVALENKDAGITANVILPELLTLRATGKRCPPRILPAGCNRRRSPV